MPNCLTLKKSNCKNCYKCIRHCPVKSIRFSGNQAHIVGNECILCGQCFVVCPQNAKEIVECIIQNKKDRDPISYWMSKNGIYDELFDYIDTLVETYIGPRY